MQIDIDKELKGFILNLEFEEKVLGRFVDSLASKIVLLPDANLIGTAMAYF